MKVRATVICESDRHILFVRKPKAKWGLPGGKVEADETIAEAAARELKEETGLKADTFLLMFEYEARHTHHYVFEACPLNAGLAAPQHEITECMWLALDKLNELDASDATKLIVRSFVRRL
ncbi:MULTISPECIES: NUDIX domain-containing protein [unclassified Pseudomonas]|uniref:NUDIX hydrolase n=1 Tax=unclassified Pseudomonas TaxID=196821 RepID=UPI0010329859|nr:MULTISPECIES: NUDIX domain-containing protein [unclassified Pseudomonas]